jgi:hypothetical protein
MDVMSLLIGLFATGFGLWTAFARLNRPQTLGKLRAMKERFGPRVGGGMHFFVYTVVPLGFGIAYTGKAVLGQSGLG